MTKTDKKYREETAARVKKQFEALKSQRTNWDSHWQEIAQRIWPQQSNLFNMNGGNQTEGDKRTQEFFDSTGATALNRFGSILDSLLTPASRTWHRLKASDDKLMDDYETRVWFEEVNRILFKERYAPTANFSSQMQLYWKMLGAYGTASMFIDPLKGLRGERGLRYKLIHLSGLYFRENHQGIIDTIYRWYKSKARNAVQEFGEENLPDGIVRAAKTNPDTEFEFIHCVEPRSDYDEKRLDHKGMVFASYYVALEGCALVEEGGYNTMPYPTSRYEQVPNETYGRGPAMDVLPSLKTLNEMKKTWLKQGHRAVDPVLLTHDDGVMDSFSMRPGALNPGGVNADGRPLVQPLPVGNVQMGEELMDREGKFVEDSFLVSIFQILAENPQQTATEVMERAREKGMLLAPLGRQQTECLGPVIERELDILITLKKLPPMPPLLIEAKGEYGITYESPLTRTARAEEAAGAMRTIEMALNYATTSGDPSCLDHLDMDEILPDVADINGVPAKWLRSQKDIEDIRAGRAKATQQQQAVNALPNVAAMTKAGAASRKADAEIGEPQ